MAFTAVSQAQNVGINTETPQVTLDIVKQSGAASQQTQGVIFPRISKEERDQFRNVPVGTMIFNTTKNCVDWFDGINWQCTDGTQIDAGNFNPEVNGTDKVFTITSANEAYILSVRDDDYFPYTAPTAEASLGSQSADGNADPLMDYQGRLGPKSSPYLKKVAIRANCTSGDCKYPAMETKTTIPVKYLDGEDYDQTVYLYIPAGTLQQGASYRQQFIEAYIYTEREIKFKTLDINKGIGTGGKGIKVCTFSGMPMYNSSNFSLDLYIIPGILDRHFKQKTNEYAADGGYAEWAADDYEHQFAYLPMLVNGKVWLNLNLGAEYADINSKFFSPTASNKDGFAVGSLFQYGRNADGHELVTWDGIQAGTAKNSTTSTKADNKYNAKTRNFIISNYRWTSPDQDYSDNEPTAADWLKDGKNNPCPQGFQVPLLSDYVSATAGALILPGYNSIRRKESGAISGKFGYYYTRENSKDYNSSGDGGGVARVFQSNNATTSLNIAYGLCVRCIKAD